ncbi:MAG TPA: CRISPR-associated endonuclease Cas2 [Candidatus Paceibacterota bacterium]
MGPTQKKVLLLLLGGILLGFTYSPYGQRKVYREINKEWKKIDREKFRKSISALQRSKDVSIKQNADDSYTYTLSKKGKKKALTYKFQEMKIFKHPWDGKWRLVTFDVPEDYKRARDALRKKLRQLGFQELQKSVFIFPYECENEIDFIVEFFGIRKYVRYGVLESIDNDSQLRKTFGK